MCPFRLQGQRTGCSLARRWSLVHSPLPGEAGPAGKAPALTPVFLTALPARPEQAPGSPRLSPHLAHWRQAPSWDQAPLGRAEERRESYGAASFLACPLPGWAGPQELCQQHQPPSSPAQPEKGGEGPAHGHENSRGGDVCEPRARGPVGGAGEVGGGMFMANDSHQLELSPTLPPGNSVSSAWRRE